MLLQYSKMLLSIARQSHSHHRSNLMWNISLAAHQQPGSLLERAQPTMTRPVHSMEEAIGSVTEIQILS
jgi:hypothetical protein